MQKIIKDYQFNEEQIDFISKLINRYGEENVHCDVNTYKYFNAKYVKDLINNPIINNDVPAYGTRMIQQINNILTNVQPIESILVPKPAFIENIDWTELKKHKVIVDEIMEENSNDRYQAIKAFFDIVVGVQDYVVDILKIEKEDVVFDKYKNLGRY